MPQNSDKILDTMFREYQQDKRSKQQIMAEAIRSGKSPRNTGKDEVSPDSDIGRLIRRARESRPIPLPQPGIPRYPPRRKMD